MIAVVARVSTGALLIGVAAVQAATLQPTDDPSVSVIWQKVRGSVFQDRAIMSATPGLLGSDAPARAIDAAVVPIAIRSGSPQTPERFVGKLYLIIDAKPSPISAIFGLTPESGLAESETRVRVDAGKAVFSTDVDFSMSENPDFRFYFQPQGRGQLRVSAVDSRYLRFDTVEALQLPVQ